MRSLFDMTYPQTEISDLSKSMQKYYFPTFSNIPARTNIPTVFSESKFCCCLLRVTAFCESPDPFD